MSSSAFAVFRQQLTDASLRQYRQDLVSLRGNFSNGRLAENMDMKLKDEVHSADTAAPLLSSPLPKNCTMEKIFASRTSGGSESGFVFDTTGTARIGETLSQQTKLKIADELSDNLLFVDPEKKQLWQSATQAVKRQLIAADLRQMLHKTDIQYRIHGDRLHYLVIGKVSATWKKKHQVWPLLLFSCTQTDAKKLQVEVEQTGFVNFWVDEKILDHELTNFLGGNLEVTVDKNFPAWLERLRTHLSAIVFSHATDVICETDFSLLGIVTGFETEYVDRAWKEILP